jgi:lipoate-protein ligase B
LTNPFTGGASCATRSLADTARPSELRAGPVAGRGAGQYRSVVSSLRWCFLGRVSYAPARETQERLAAERAASGAGDRLLLLEHDPVVTSGHPFAAEDRGDGAVPRLQVRRGGLETYHGPGQLVAYPVIALRAGGRGVRTFVAALEGALSDVANAYGVVVWSRPDRPGVWTGPAERPAKLGFVGLGVRRGVTLHGCTLNVEHRAADGFAGIVPCGLPGVEVTSLEALAPQRAPRVAAAARIFALALAERLRLEPLEEELERSAHEPATTRFTPAGGPWTSSPCSSVSRAATVARSRA